MIDTATLNELTAVIDDVTSELVAGFFAKVDIDLGSLSLAEKVSLWPQEMQKELLWSGLSDAEKRQLPYTWEFWGRPKQIAPAGDWQYWLILAGRGFGKSRTICEWAIDKAISMPGSRGALVAATAADVRDVLIEGPSGILACSPPSFMPVYEPSKRRLTWPNGTTATTFSADQPDRLRGPQFHWAIADELAAWRYLEQAWDMLQFGLRLGENPQCAIATTPRPLKILKDMVEGEGSYDEDTCVVTHGTTYENQSNLADKYFSKIIKKYEGTRLGRQELDAQILSDVKGALWTQGGLDATRVVSYPLLHRIAVAVDPAASTGQTGIVVVGIAEVNGVVHGYTLADHTLEEGASPGEWGAEVVAAYNKWGADVIVGEVNNGGDMVEHVIRTVEGGKDVNYKMVRASRGKYTRAEPVAALYEQKRGHMVGHFAFLEEELREWVPGMPSPNRLDAMVWGYTELILDNEDDDGVTETSEPVVHSAASIFG